MAKLLDLNIDAMNPKPNALEHVLYGMPPLIRKTPKKIIKYTWILEAASKKCVLKHVDYPNIDDLYTYENGVLVGLDEDAQPYLVSAEIKGEPPIQRMVYIDKKVEEKLKDIKQFMKWNKAKQYWDTLADGIAGQINDGNGILLDLNNTTIQSFRNIYPDLFKMHRIIQGFILITPQELVSIANDLKGIIHQMLKPFNLAIPVFPRKEYINIKEDMEFTVEAWIDYVRWSEKNDRIDNIMCNNDI